MRFLLFTVLFFSLYSCNKTPKVPSEFEEETFCEQKEPCYIFNICVDSFCVKEQQISSNQTFSSILTDFGVSNQMISELVSKSRGVFNVGRIKKGNLYTAVLSNDSVAKLHYLIYKENHIDYVIFNLKDTLVYREKKEIKKRRRVISGKIEESLWGTIAKLKTTPLLAIRLSEIYESQIDFFEITERDSFKVIFDEMYIEDTILVDVGEVYACVFSHNGEDNYAFAFYQDDKLNYFDEKGENVKRAFLKAPLKYFRISSRFTNSRYHPVLKIYRPHHGIDYAAPTGTPVYAIGAGVIQKKGYQAYGGGNFISIKHPNAYKTTYMHLRRFAKGIRVGKKVEQGELIGYVGSTGLSSGPHLDFRVYKNGSPINPLKVVSPRLEPLEESLRDSFEKKKALYLEELKIKKSL